jgi:hypothetical protein
MPSRSSGRSFRLPSDQPYTPFGGKNSRCSPERETKRQSLYCLNHRFSRLARSTAMMRMTTPEMRLRRRSLCSDWTRRTTIHVLGSLAARRYGMEPKLETSRGADTCSHRASCSEMKSATLPLLWSTLCAARATYATKYTVLLAAPLVLTLAPASRLLRNSLMDGRILPNFCVISLPVAPSLPLLRMYSIISRA